MNCRNCGAAMELHAARRYFFCAHCGSFHFPERVDAEVQVLGAPAAPAACPVCRVSLKAAVLDDRVEARYCEPCRGVLLSRADFAHLVEARRAWATTPPVTPLPLDRRELTRTLRCPGCGQTLSVHPYYGPGNVVIDTCERCHLIWLDYGELRQISDAPGRDRGRGSRLSPHSHEPPPDLLGILAARVARREDDDDT